jgi:nitroimidazol reductase NimA-like FMN-containing flavoprotein (pyridoxamine 5'-phosphate oxidase superfamily)
MSAPPAAGFDRVRQLEIIRRAIARNSFCVLATSSERDRPHAVGLLYAAVDLTIYLTARQDTIKVRNMRANPLVAVAIPVRTYPFAPPMAVQFQGRAELLAPGDPHITELRRAGQLKKITGRGTADAPGTVFVRVTPGRRISSYGLGVPLRQLLRDTSQGTRSVDLP